MDNYVGVEVLAPPFLTSALDGVEWSVSRSGYFTSGEIVLRTHWIADWVGPRARLEAVEKEKCCPAGNRTPTIQPVAISPTPTGPV
jgi:hypothetical protein